MVATTATIIRNGEKIEIPIKNVTIGDIVLFKETSRKSSFCWKQSTKFDYKNISNAICILDKTCHLVLLLSKINVILNISLLIQLLI